MYTLKSFMIVNTWVNNEPGIVSELGELSLLSRSYSKEKGTYTHSDYNDTSLVSFVSRLEGEDVSIPESIKDDIFDFANWVVLQGKLGNIDTKANFLQALHNKFSTATSYVTCGEIVTDGNISMPQYVSWVEEGNDPHEYKIWYSDSAFQLQYDEYEIIVIPPLTPVDDLYLPYTTLKPLLDVNDSAYLINQTHEATREFPCTLIKGLEILRHEYDDPTNTVLQIETHWSVAIYGRAGDTNDRIRNAIGDYILANSAHDRLEWSIVLPDIFNPTEFTLIPFWDAYSDPFQELKEGIYSPVTNILHANDMAVKFMPEYPQTHIIDNAMLSTSLWRSIAFVCCASPGGSEQVGDLMDVFPDYMLVSSTSIDYNRMSPKTQGWVYLLHEMLSIAEVMDEMTTLPSTMGRVIRGDYTYLSSTYEGISYNIISKLSYLGALNE